jgi:hypothetical protein
MFDFDRAVREAFDQMIIRAYDVPGPPTDEVARVVLQTVARWAGHLIPPAEVGEVVVATLREPVPAVIVTKIAIPGR